MIGVYNEAEGTAAELARKRAESPEWQAKVAERIAELAADTEAWIDREMQQEREVRRAEWRAMRHAEIQKEVLEGLER